MLTRLNLPRLIHTEFYQFIKLILDIVEKANPTALKIKDEWEQLAQLMPSMLDAVNNEAASEETKDIKALDLKRDEAIQGLIKAIDGYTLHEDAAKKDAADLLLLFIEAQGPRIHRLNYSAETAVLSKITTTFKNDAKYAAALTVLGAADWVVNMETANTNFEAKYAARNTSLTIKENVPSFGALREKAIPLFTELTDMIVSRYKTAKADKQPVDAYLNLINEMNTLIDSFQPYTIPGKAKPKPENPTEPA